MAKLPKVIFFTNCEYGQSNVILAVAKELVKQEGFHVHIASSAALASRVDLTCGNIPAESNVTLSFHELPGKSMIEAAEAVIGLKGLSHPPGLRGAINSYNKFPKMLSYWADPPYMERAEHCKSVLESVTPTVVVIDPTFGPAMDACKMLNIKYVILAPIGLSDLVAAV